MVDRIHPELAAWLQDADTAERRNVIVTLSPSVPWAEGRQRVAAAGLQVRGGEELLRVVFGRGSADVVRRLGDSRDVQWVEPDAEARATGEDP